MKEGFKLFVSVAVSIILLSMVSLGQSGYSKPITVDDLSGLLERNEKYSFERDRYETTREWRERIIGDSFRSEFCVNLTLKPKLRYSADAEMFTLDGFTDYRIGLFRLDSPLAELDGTLSVDYLRRGLPFDSFKFQMPRSEAREAETHLIASVKGCIVGIETFFKDREWIGSVKMIAEDIDIIDSKTGVLVQGWSYPDWSSKTAQKK